MQPLSCALPLAYVPAFVTRVVLWLLIGTRLHLLEAEFLSTARLLCSPPYLYGTISMTLDDVALAGFKSRANALWRPNLLFPFVFHYFLFFFLPWIGCERLGSPE